MKLAVINGSPKVSGSTSELIIKQLERHLGEKIDIYHAITLLKQDSAKIVEIGKVLDYDALLIIFPLYVDSLPAPLIEVLSRLENIVKSETSPGNMRLPQIYSVTNCGFFEAEQNSSALKMIEHFATRAGLPWGYGIGIGGGGMLSSMGDNWSGGPVSVVHNALRDMAIAIKNKDSKQNVFVSPKFPRWLYLLAADIGMRQLAKRNGVKNIRAKPYIIP